MRPSSPDRSTRPRLTDTPQLTPWYIQQVGPRIQPQSHQQHCTGLRLGISLLSFSTELRCLLTFALIQCSPTLRFCIMTFSLVVTLWLFRGFHAFSSCTSTSSFVSFCHLAFIIVPRSKKPSKPTQRGDRGRASATERTKQLTCRVAETTGTPIVRMRPA